MFQLKWSRILLSFSFLFCSIIALALQHEFITTFGRVVNESGEPIAGVEIISKKRVDGVQKELFRLKSDRNGVFKLKVPHLHGRFDVLPTPEGYYPFSYFQLENTLPPYTKEYVVVMKKGKGHLTGVITDQNNNAVPGTKVNVQFLKWRKKIKIRGVVLRQGYLSCILTAITNENGRYKFDNLFVGEKNYAIKSVIPPAETKLFALNGGFHGFRSFKISKGSAAVCDFQLLPGGSIQGRVLNCKGDPVAGAEVKAFVDSATVNGPESLYPRLGQSFLSHAETDEDGTFLLSSLSKETYQIKVTPSKDTGWAEKTVRMIILPEKGNLALSDVVLYPSGGLTFKVLDDASQALANANIEVFKNDFSIDFMWGVMKYSLKQIKHSWTNDKGECEFPHLNQGNYQILVRPSENSDYSLKWFKDINVIAGLNTSCLLELPKANTYTGQIVDEMGTAVPDCKILLWHRYYRRSAKSDANGKFEICGIPDEEVLSGFTKFHKNRKSRLTVFPPKSMKSLRVGHFNFKGNAFPSRLKLVSGSDSSDKDKNTLISGIVKWPSGKKRAGFLIAQTVDMKRKKINRTVFVDSSGSFSIKGRALCFEVGSFQSGIFQ